MLKNSFVYPVLVAGLMLLAALVSIFWLQGQSLRLDESQSLWQTSHSPGQLLTIVAQDVHVPLHHLLLHFWQLFFGNLVQTARALSLIFFVLTIPVVYVTGREAFSRNTGLFAAALIETQPISYALARAVGGVAETVLAAQTWEATELPLVAMGQRIRQASPAVRIERLA